MSALDVATAIALGGILPAFAFVGPLVASLRSRQEDAGIALGHQDFAAIRLRDQRAKRERDRALLRQLKARLAATRALRGEAR